MLSFAQILYPSNTLFVFTEKNAGGDMMKHFLSKTVGSKMSEETTIDVKSLLLQNLY